MICKVLHQPICIQNVFNCRTTKYQLCFSFVALFIFIFFCILYIWHPFYQFAFKFSTLQFCSSLALIVVFKGLSQNMNTLEAVECKTVCHSLLSNQHRHHAKTYPPSTATNALNYPFKSIIVTTSCIKHCIHLLKYCFW